jgi:hypothetical protein
MTVFGNRHGLEVVEQGLFVVFSDRGLRAVDAIVTFYRDRWLVDPSVPPDGPLIAAGA